MDLRVPRCSPGGQSLMKGEFFHWTVAMGLMKNQDKAKETRIIYNSTPDFRQSCKISWVLGLGNYAHYY